MGEMAVPLNALWAAQTQRALQNFPASGLRMPLPIVHAMALIKAAAATANAELGDLTPEKSTVIRAAALQVASGAHDDQFPLDVFQTGSGTSTNMNVNEVIATLASRAAETRLDPNDHVNMSQSSNDVMPSAIHVAATLAVERELLPSMQHLADSLQLRAREFSGVAKTGRTHLMDAMPVTLGQEISGWQSQIEMGIARLHDVLPRLRALAQGATAVGTGINARDGFAARVMHHLDELTGTPFAAAGNPFAALACQDTVVELSGHLKTLAASLTKICNDLRWMNSGPLAGLGEIRLPALQPGSSIMPGKVNPVIPESVLMMCAQIIGNDATITLGGHSGNFELNVMLPVIAHNVLESIRLAALGCRTLADRAIAGFAADREHMVAQLAKNPILVTALNPVIGYQRGAELAKRAWQEGRAVIDIALEQGVLTREDLEKLLDPLHLTRGGVQGKAESG